MELSILRQDHHSITDGSLSGRVRGTIDQCLSDSHSCGAATVEVDSFFRTQCAHNVRALPEARSDAVAGSVPVHRGEEQIAVGHCPGQSARVALDTEAVVKLRVLRPMKAFGVGSDIYVSTAEQGRDGVENTKVL